MRDFTHLHLHASSSPRWGVRPAEEFCRAAAAMGLRRLALTDRNGLYGIPRFLAAAREAGIAPIIGAEAVTGGERALLLARDAEGYGNLCRLLSELHSEADFRLGAALLRHRRGLTILGDDPELLGPLLHQSRDNLGVELSPGHGLPRALALARRLGLPPVATSRAVLLEPEDFELHRVLRAIALNTKLSRLRPGETALAGDRLLPPERLAGFFPHCPEALGNAGRIAASCRTDWDFSGTIFPAFRGLAEGQALATLEERARAGARRRYGRVEGRVEERLRKELGLIGAKGFAHYFLVVAEIAARSPRTCGRGSAAASLVAYCLGITHVDPLRHNLFFERFLNEGRSDPPDIDIDFPWDERDEVLDFVFRRYGGGQAAMVANQIGFRSRAAVREVAKVFGIPEAEIAAFASRAGEEPPSGDWQEVLRLAGRLDGQLRHLSLHCGGVVIVPGELRRHVPVERSAKGLPVIQWEKDQAEAGGLVKVDILGNRSLAVIRDALEAVRRNTGRVVDYAAWRPLDDAATRRLLRSGQTMGCFYIESPATRQLLGRMWGERPVAGEVDLFEHLVMASSIIRPAANAYILEFVARLRGKPWQRLHPLLGEVLDETYGIAIYQEQISLMAMALAGFSPTEGDQLRKIVSKKHKSASLADYRQRFLEGGGGRGVPPEVLEEAWGQILSFAGYSFCKPHSASYALVSCKAAWLKANHPAEFMAAVIANGGGFYSPLAYLSEARRLGLEVLPPDINASDAPCTGRGRSLRIGLAQIRELTRRTVERVLREREAGGEFSSFREFLRRVPVDPADGRQLVKAGCFDRLEGAARRASLLWELLANRRQEARSGSLFEEPGPPLRSAPPCDRETLLRQELEALGMPVSCHPLAFYRRELERLRPVPARELLRRAGRRVAMVGWRVAEKRVRDKNGRAMAFVCLEDETALFDVTFFPEAFEKFGRRLPGGRPWLLEGRVEEAFGVATLTVERAEALVKDEREETTAGPGFEAAPFSP